MSTSLRNTNVLIVDDDPDTCNLLLAVLKQSGASVTMAQSVDGAVQAFRRCPAHAVITDIRIGDSDGYALLEAIRRCNLEYKGFTPVIAVTGYASPEDQQRAIAAGFNAYLPKPFDPGDVVTAITRTLWGTVDLAA